jgi:catechol 2,3-dioxygenase-like lactoylglutathione lyase family enzyme
MHFDTFDWALWFVSSTRYPPQTASHHASSAITHVYRHDAPMPLKTLAHCGMVVRDLSATRGFYVDVVGMTEIARPSNFKFGGAWFRCGDSELHMILAADTVAPPGFHDPGVAVRTGLATHIAFEVDDLAAMHARLLAGGVTIQGGPLKRGDGVEQLYVFDPDGYMIEFFQWVRGSEIGADDRAAIA